VLRVRIKKSRSQVYPSCSSLLFLRAPVSSSSEVNQASSLMVFLSMFFLFIFFSIPLCFCCLLPRPHFVPTLFNTSSITVQTPLHSIRVSKTLGNEVKAGRKAGRKSRKERSSSNTRTEGGARGQGEGNKGEGRKRSRQERRDREEGRRRQEIETNNTRHSLPCAHFHCRKGSNGVRWSLPGKERRKEGTVERSLLPRCCRVFFSYIVRATVGYAAEGEKGAGGGVCCSGCAC
jgi:hypothetical protein